MRLTVWATVLLLVMFALTGCSGKSAKVSGRVTCDGKPVAGGILFSPKGDGGDNTGPPVNAALDEDGRYTLNLKSIGAHRVMITPSDLPPPSNKGKGYPCNLSNIEREVNAGTNEIVIELSKRAP